MTELTLVDGVDDLVTDLQTQLLWAQSDNRSLRRRQARAARQRRRVAIVAALLASFTTWGVSQAATTKAVDCQTHPHDCQRAISWLRRVADARRDAVLWQRKERLRVRQLDGRASLLTPIEVGRVLARRWGWGDRQAGCLITLWNRESGWQISDPNPASDADGIPQANPAWKMASAGRDWRTNPATQIRWGLGYIAARYGTPCAALSHSDTFGYY